MSTPHVPSLAVLVIAAAFAGVAAGQGEQTFVHPLGHVVMDDMFVPVWAASGDGNWQGDPWPAGIVPYLFDGSISAANRTSMLRAMAEIEAVCSARFVERTFEPSFVIIRRNMGSDNYSCADVGQVGPAVPQFLNIGINHFAASRKFTLVHELMHTLGFKHEHMRTDRSSYVAINAANISQTACNGGPCDGNFSVSVSAVPTGPYDFASIMHYPANSQAADPSQPVIIALPNYAQFQDVMGNRNYMTALDAQALQTLYGFGTIPNVTSISTNSVVAGSVGLVLIVQGSGFLEGSFTSEGVQGSVVRWNTTTTLETTWIDANTLRAIIPASLLQTPGTHTIRVRNDPLAGGFSSSINAPTFTVTAPPCPTQADRVGRAVCGLGDVDGDGHDDYAIGAPGHGNNLGRVMCFSGHSGVLLWNAFGTLSDEQFGYTLANAGDVTGDGIDDVLAGAPGWSSNRGRVRVLRGHDGVEHRFFLGSNPGDEFGYAVANAGDVNLDGIPDHVIGIPNGFGVGGVQVRSGSNGALFWQIVSPQSGSRFGAALGGGHDLTGDGRPEFIVGAPFYNGPAGQDAGRAYVYQGAFATLSRTIDGSGAYDFLGWSVAVMPSPSPTSSRGKILVGAPEIGSVFGTGGGTGYVHLIRGQQPLGNSWVTEATWRGVLTGDRYGQFVGPASDLDDDGHGDVLVGAVQQGVAGTTTPVGPGYVEVRSGRTGGSVIWRQPGATNGEEFGWTAAVVGDTDGDAQRDVLVGIPFGNVPCFQAGSYRLFHPRIPPSTEKVMITEVVTGSPAGVELTNFAPDAVNLTNWRLRWRDGTVYETPSLGVTIQPGESIVVMEPGLAYSETPRNTQILFVLPINPTGSGDVGIALVAANGVTVDEVHVASGPLGTYGEGSLGGLFRGRVHGAEPPFVLPFPRVNADRVWGLDSNGGADWTTGGTRSMGLENSANGVFGLDPLPVARVLINEVADGPDYLELVNAGRDATCLEGWSLLISDDQNASPMRVRPFPGCLSLSADAYAVLGDSAIPPAEMPSGTLYVDLSAVGGGGNLPLALEEASLALYDGYGRLADLVRSTGHDDVVVHNHPRAPGSWSAFTGAAIRGSASYGRNAQSRDRDTGEDFRALFGRSMGRSNGLGARTGQLPAPDVRLHDTALHGGLTLIINAGAEHAGEAWSFTFTVGHLGGQGPIFGLGPTAIQNWLVLGATPPWFGTLDSRGSARLDVSPGSIPPGLAADTIFLTQSATGIVTSWTFVLEFDVF